MNLLNNLIQMQGLENSITQQQLMGLMPQQMLSSSALSNDPGSSGTTATVSTSTNTTAPASSSSNLILEQQIKISQVQQLQSQIFQQQVFCLPFFFHSSHGALTGWMLFFFGFRSQLSVVSPWYYWHCSFWMLLGWSVVAAAMLAVVINSPVCSHLVCSSISCIVSPFIPSLCCKQACVLNKMLEFRNSTLRCGFPSPETIHKVGILKL